MIQVSDREPDSAEDSTPVDHEYISEFGQGIHFERLPSPDYACMQPDSETVFSADSKTVEITIGRENVNSVEVPTEVFRIMVDRFNERMEEIEDNAE